MIYVQLLNAECTYPKHVIYIRALPDDVSDAVQTTELYPSFQLLW